MLESFAMRTGFVRNVLMGLLLLMAGGIFAGEPLRLLVQTPQGGWNGQDLKDRTLCAEQCLAMYLAEWFSQGDSGVRLLDETQAANVLNSIKGDACSVQPTINLCTAVQTSTAVDGVVTWNWSNGKLVMSLHLPAGVKTREIPWSDTKATPGALKAATDWLSSELGVNPKASPLARGLPSDAPDMIENYYFSQRLSTVWVYNSGEERLKMMRPYLTRLPKDIWTAVAIVHAGTRASTDGRAVLKPAALIMMLQQALPALMGTELEPVARHFCEVNRLLPDVIEKFLMTVIEKAGQDEIDAALSGESTGTSDSPMDAAPGKLNDAKEGGALAALAGVKTVPQQAGAIRCLGVMKSKAALPAFVRISKATDPELRRAVAWALASYPAPAGDAELAALSQDKDAPTAFLAAWAKWKRSGKAPDDLTRRAAACLDETPGCEEALEALAAAGSAADAPRLIAALAKPNGKVRIPIAAGLLRIGALDAAGLKAVLADYDAAVLRAALAALPGSALQSQRERLMVLANHPDVMIAEASRGRLTTLLPADPRERRYFELATEHPYVRGQILAALAKDGSAAALDELADACKNADAHTRALAIKLLAEKSPEKARPAAMQLLHDSHRYVRLHAAAVAARVAAATDIAVLKQVIAIEKDEATRLYMEDALARAEGKTLPAPRPSAHMMSLDKTTTFLCVRGEDCVRSPTQGYYELSYLPDEPARKAYAAGKQFLARSNKTAKNPAQVLLDSYWRDGFWLGMDKEFGDIAALDGIILGEESMYFAPWNMWDSGWSLFCREAGIDVRRVAGDKKNLTDLEKQAWWNWEQRIAIEGFNTMYDWIKLNYGKLRPGFQVGTFMPDQNGPCDFDREWKFDIAAGYYYETNNRNRYTQIRRYKTLWPDRPALWLYDGAPFGCQGPALNYKYPALQSPLQDLHSRFYADALCSWLAGADPGAYYASLAIGKDMKPGPLASGVWMSMEIMDSSMPGALANIFAGVDETYRTELDTKKAKEKMSTGDLAIGAIKSDDTIELEEYNKEKDPFKLRVKAETERMRLGLLLERKLNWDSMRLLADLPRPKQINPVLLVGDVRAEKGALRLPSSYDALSRINDLAGQDLSRYRVIAMANAETAALSNSTITRLTDWLKNTPGLLYVRGWVNSNNTAEAAVIGDLDGKLEVEWPWIKDLTFADKKYSLTGGNTVAIGGGEKPLMMYWQAPGFKGGVVFDASDLAPEKLRDELNKLCKEKGIGSEFTGPIGVEAGSVPGIRAMTSCQVAAADSTLKGVDLLTGILDPVIAKGRTGALIADAFTGTYVASWNGVGVLGEQPLGTVKAVAGGLEVESKGLLQAVSTGGDVELRFAGNPPPTIPPEKVLAWMLLSQDPGQARVEREDKRSAITYLRADGKITITVKNKTQ